MPSAHKHMILKGTLTDPPEDEDTLTLALTEIVGMIGMEILAEPRARYCFEEGNEGFTGDVLLTTSHMIYHDWEYEGEEPWATVQFDLYSCADFNPFDVVSYLSMVFGLKDYQFRVFDREYDIVQTFEFRSAGLDVTD